MRGVTFRDEHYNNVYVRVLIGSVYACMRVFDTTTVTIATTVECDLPLGKAQRHSAKFTRVTGRVVRQQTMIDYNVTPICTNNRLFAPVT